MNTKLILLLLQCVHAFHVAPRVLVVRHAAVLRQPSTVATLTEPPARVAVRPVLVPALSYGAVAATAVAISKATAMAGFAGMTIGGLTMPTATALAVAAPALLMLFEFYFFGGGERVAKMMGGVPADAKLTKLVTDVAQRAGLDPPAHVFEIPTNELNAFAAGFGSNDATVAVTTGLRNTLSEVELQAVIAHEIGHIHHSDMRTSMHLAVAIAGLGGIYEIGRMIVRSQENRDTSKSDDEEGSVVPLGFAMMLGGLAARFAGHLIQLSVSRSAEYDADRVAAELCGSAAMIAALEKIQTTTDTQKPRSQHDAAAPAALAEFRGGAFAHSYISSGETSRSGPDPKARPGASWWKGLQTAFSTHPTTESRIEALKKRPPKA